MKAIIENQLTINDVSIHYKEKNVSSSKILLCLHALGHSLKDYDKVFKSREFDTYRIIALDFPGHGKSSIGKEPVSSAYYAKLMGKFIKKLSLQNVVILGNSIGGAVAIRLAADTRNNITSIQLANTAGLDKRGFISKIFLSCMVWFFKKGVTQSPKFKKWFRYYYSKVLPSIEATERRNEIVNEAYKIASILVEGWNSFKLSSEDLREIASNLSCPVLVTWAMKDKKVQFKRNINAINKINDLKLIKYNIGHTPILENSKQFITDLSNFLISQEHTLSYKKSK